MARVDHAEEPGGGGGIQFRRSRGTQDKQSMKRTTHRVTWSSRGGARLVGLGRRIQQKLLDCTIGHGLQGGNKQTVVHDFVSKAEAEQRAKRSTGKYCSQWGIA